MADEGNPTSRAVYAAGSQAQFALLQAKGRQPSRCERHGADFVRLLWAAPVLQTISYVCNALGSSTWPMPVAGRVLVAATGERPRCVAFEGSVLPLVRGEPVLAAPTVTARCFTGVQAACR